jgi:3-methyladenine DNA glycosylase/8-oxoguanine DNA glycosylase
MPVASAAPSSSVTTTRDGLVVRYASARPLHVWQTLMQCRHGVKDQTFRWVSHREVWMTSLLRSGPVTRRIVQDGPTGAVVSLWGAGAREAATAVPALLGEDDDAAGFAPPRVVRETVAARPGMRMPTTGEVFAALVPTILEQRVQADAAHLSWHRLVTLHGTAAPGPAPAGMRVVPSATQWRLIPTWDWHRAGVEAARSRIINGAAHVAGRLEGAANLPVDHARAFLEKVPGIGPWTSAEVVQRTHGAADAYSPLDYNLPKLVGHALAGERTDEAGMHELLAPYAPRRHRLIRHLRAHDYAGPGTSRRGPRTPLQDRRGW